MYSATLSNNMDDLDYSCSSRLPARCGPINSGALSNKKPATKAQYPGHLDNQLDCLSAFTR